MPSHPPPCVQCGKSTGLAVQTKPARFYCPGIGLAAPIDMGQGMYGVGAATGINSNSTFTGVVECEEGYFCAGTRRVCVLVVCGRCRSRHISHTLLSRLPLYLIAHRGRFPRREKDRVWVDCGVLSQAIAPVDLRQPWLVHGWRRLRKHRVQVNPVPSRLLLHRRGETKLSRGLVRWRARA